MSRIEHDSMGELEIADDKLWMAQTQRSVNNFPIGRGKETMPGEIIHALAYIKKASALANYELLPTKMTGEKCRLICNSCDAILSGRLEDQFPLVVWQTGSGTQSNMNVNEVITGYANRHAGAKILHPNDDVNMSQSSNDTFPTAMHISAVIGIKNKLLPELQRLINCFITLENKFDGIIKCGRTHLQDATPLTFSQEISGWRSSLQKDYAFISDSLAPLCQLALGGTAVGTGINAPRGFDILVAKKLSELTGEKFVTSDNKFHSLTSKDELVFAHGAMKALACDLMKIANDIRFLASGPRLGYGEITIPANEPGSSIMPGKVNPTQCEQVTMVAVQVMGNDATIGIAASQGNFELNVFMPVIAYNFLQSVRLLTESMASFNDRCVCGIQVKSDKMENNLQRSLMLVTALSPYIGYENCAKVAKHAYENNITLKESCISLGFLSGSDFDKYFSVKSMV